jgi:hypothetical protein
LLLQYEIRRNHYWRRVHWLAEAMGLNPDELEDRLQVLSLRGKSPTWPKIQELARDYDLVVIDPLYKVYGSEGADENSATDVAVVLAHFDQLAEKSDAAVALVHHSAKGLAGDRMAIDRGAGSGVLARDYDACITLAPHESQQNAVVVETVLRNYPPMEPFTTEWADGCFQTASDISAISACSSNAWNQQQKSDHGERAAEMMSLAQELLSEGPIHVSELKEVLRENGSGKGLADDVVGKLGRKKGYARWKSKSFPSYGMIGLADDSPAKNSILNST